MPIYKRCGRCGKRLLEGTSCGCYKRSYKEYDKTSRDSRSKAFYGSAEWTRARKEALDLDGGIDVYVYMTTGEILIADTVHHIEPLKEAWEERTNVCNLISLNHSTHGRIEKMYQEDKEKAIRELKEMIEKYRAEEGRGG